MPMTVGGGIRGEAADRTCLDAGVETGADGVAVGTLMIFSDNNLVRIKRYPISRGRPIRRL